MLRMFRLHKGPTLERHQNSMLISDICVGVFNVCNNISSSSKSVPMFQFVFLWRRFFHMWRLFVIICSSSLTLLSMDMFAYIVCLFACLFAY